MAPATVGLAAVQVNIFVSTIFASHEHGRGVLARSTRSASSTCPSAIFGVAVGTVATTGLAQTRRGRRHARGCGDTLRAGLAAASRS